MKEVQTQTTERFFIRWRLYFYPQVPPGSDWPHYKWMFWNVRCRKYEHKRNKKWAKARFCDVVYHHAMCTSSMDTLHWWKQFLPSTNIVIGTLGKWPGCSIKNKFLTWNLQLVSISALKPKAATRLRVTAPTAELTRWRAGNWINQEIEILVEAGK